MKNRALWKAIFLLLFCLTARAETVIAQEAQGVFDFEQKTVLLNSGYEMPIMGLGAYSLDYDTLRQLRESPSGKWRQTDRYGLHVRQ